MRAGVPAGEEGGFGGLNRDDTHVRVLALEDLRHARNRSARAHAGHENVDLAVSVRPNLFARVRDVCRGVRGVCELGGDDRAGPLGGDVLGFGNGCGHAALGVGEDEFGAEGAHDRSALHRHGGWHDDHDLVAARRADHGQGDSRVARRRLDDGTAGAEGSRRLSGIDDRAGDAVLDRGSRVERLNLGDHVNAFADDVVDPNEGGGANQIGDGGGDTCHVKSFQRRLCTTIVIPRSGARLVQPGAFPRSETLRHPPRLGRGRRRSSRGAQARSRS